LLGFEHTTILDKLEGTDLAGVKPLLPFGYEAASEFIRPYLFQEQVVDSVCVDILLLTHELPEGDQEGPEQLLVRFSRHRAERALLC
jgi:hypothetical protein